MDDNRLSYTIKACSTEAPGYPAENLLSISTVGWRSTDLCDFPQSIVCKLPSISHVHKIQLLGHNYLIPQRVLLYIGNFNNKYEKHIWKKIGFVTFSDNSNTNYKQRELKTISLKDMSISGQYLKFEIYQNHDNKKNIFNQVGIDAINVIGSPKLDHALDLAERYLKKAERENIDPNGSPSVHEPSVPSKSPASDPQTQDMLRKMKEEKKVAEEKEDFDLANSLKVTITACMTFSDQIWLCDVEKQQKVSEEQYDAAKGFKIRRDELKLRRDRLIDENLYEYGLTAEYFNIGDGNSKTTVSSSKSSNEDNGYLEVSPRGSSRQVDEIEKRSIIDFNPEIEKLEVPHYEYDVDDYPEIETHRTDLSYDERGIKSHGKTFQEILDAELAKENAKNPNESDDGTVGLDDKKRRENQQYIALLGEQFVMDAISKKHVSRIRAAEQLKTIIKRKLAETENREEQKDYLRYCNHFVGQFLLDGVKEVYKEGLAVLPLLIEYCTCHYGQQTDVNYILETNIPILLKRSGEGVPNLDDIKNIHKVTKTNDILNATVNLGLLESVQKTPIYYAKSFAPFATEPKGKRVGRTSKDEFLTPKQAFARLEIVEKIIRTQQTLLAKQWDTDRYFSNTFELIEIGLKHNNSCIREKGKDILKFLYRVNDEKAREMFEMMISNDKTKEIRDKIIQNIRDDFDRIDGKPTQKELAEKRRKEEVAEATRKDGEVRELERKLAEVKEMNRQAEESKRAIHSKVPKPSSKVPAEPKESVIAESMISIDDPGDKSCIFCGEYNENFDSAGLDVHYWKHCPMLKRCGRCKMVVEISGYSAHLLDECEQKSKYIECKKCNEAVLIDELKEHELNRKICYSKKMGKAHCCLCHETVDETEQAWREHLMGQTGCSMNKRRTESLKRTQK